VMDVDYDIYAEGEAELGWLNGQVSIEAAEEFDLDQLLIDLVHRLQVRLQSAEAEVAHLKVIGMTDGGYAVANLVSSATTAELSLPSRTASRQVNVIVNARVATDPAVLESIVKSEL